MVRLVSISVLVALLFATQTFGQDLNVKRHVNLNGGVAVKTLPTTEDEGQYPVCFNGAGELLPCDSLAEPPPGNPEPLNGLWEGTMSTSDENPECYHGADVVLEISESSSDDEYVLNRVNIELAGGRTDNDSVSPNIIRSNYIATMSLYSNGLFDDRLSLNISFDEYGYAEGSWSFVKSGCYGSWLFQKM